MHNPWEEIDLKVYENHMSLQSAYQLQAFDGLNKVHHQMEENELKGAMQKIGYETGSRAEKELPNGKKLVQIDFARMKN